MIFRNVKLGNFTSKIDESGPVYRLHMSADISTNICEEMGWQVLDSNGEVVEGIKGSKLSGLLRISDFALTPNAKELQNHALSAAGQEIRGFEIASKLVDGQRQCELRFILITAGPISKIDKFWRAVGKVDSQLEVTVIEQQMELEEEEPAEEEKPEPAEEERPRSPGRARKKVVPMDQM